MLTKIEKCRIILGSVGHSAAFSSVPLPYVLFYTCRQVSLAALKKVAAILNAGDANVLVDNEDGLTVTVGFKPANKQKEKVDE